MRGISDSQRSPRHGLGQWLALLGCLGLTLLLSACVNGHFANFAILLATVESSPNTGVTINFSITSNEVNIGPLDRTTPFKITTDDDNDPPGLVTMILTAPAQDPQGNIFSNWTGCDTSDSQARTCTFSDRIKHAVSANYGPPPTRTLTVNSTNPASGVHITFTPDNNATASGDTPINSLVYNTGTAVTLTAPLNSPGGSTFTSWDCPGGTTNTPARTCLVTMNFNTTVTASYKRRLTVASEPNSGVDITFTVANGGGSSGATPFTLTFDDGTAVMLTAPIEDLQGSPFTRWIGCDTTSPLAGTCNVTMNADRTVTASYLPIPRHTLTVSSSPNMGVVVTFTVTNGGGSGTTPFTSTFDEGTAVTLTAPSDDGQGNGFVSWDCPGGTTNTPARTCLVTINADTTVTANYNPPPSLAITSLSPQSATAGGPDFSLTINGSGFDALAQVKWNGLDRTTTFVSNTQLTAQVLAADIATPTPAGTPALITVVNPDNTTSNAFPFPVLSALGSFVELVTIPFDNNGFADHGGSPTPIALGADGHFVAFDSFSTNLLAPPTTLQLNVFVRDTSCVPSTSQSCTPTTLASAVDGTVRDEMIGSSTLVGMSRDGSVVAFTSSNSSVPSAPLLVWERIGTSTLPESLNSAGLPVSTHYDAGINTTGRFVAFISEDASVQEQVYLHDNCLGVVVTTPPTCGPSTILVSANDAGQAADIGVSSTAASGPSSLAVSIDGRFVTFESPSTNLGGGPDATLYVRDTCGLPNNQVCNNPATVPVDVGPGGAVLAGSGNPSISDDGGFVLFAASDPNNGLFSVYLRDVVNSITSLVSTDFDTGAPVSGFAIGNAISSDGRYVAFVTNAKVSSVTGLDPGSKYAYVKDMCTGILQGCTPTTHLVSVDSGGNPVPVTYGVAISADGHRAVYSMFDTTNLQVQLVIANTAF